MSIPRLRMKWTGEAYVPINKLWGRVCDNNLVVEQEYWVIEEQERSKKSHNHYFAAVHTGWENLPEKYAGRFPDDDHLRKYALIMLGYCNQVELVFDNEESAILAAGQFKNLDTYSIVSVVDCVVVQLTAQTQKYREMGKDRFQKSKQDVIEFIAGLCGIDVKELTANAGKAA